jgi:hypothetical protein
LYDLPKACSGIDTDRVAEVSPDTTKTTATSRTDHEFVLQPPAMTEANVAQA